MTPMPTPGIIEENPKIDLMAFDPAADAALQAAIRKIDEVNGVDYHLKYEEVIVRQRVDSQGWAVHFFERYGEQRLHAAGRHVMVLINTITGELTFRR